MRPSGESLAQIDRPAQDNTWHEAPDLSKETLKSQLQSVYKSDAKQDIQGAVGNAAQAARQSDGTTGDRINATQSAVGGAADHLKDNVDPETRGSTKETAEQYRQRTKQYFSKKMPEERRDQTIWRLKVCTITISNTINLAIGADARSRKWLLNVNNTPITSRQFPHCLTWLSSMAVIARALLPEALALSRRHDPALPLLKLI